MTGGAATVLGPVPAGWSVARLGDLAAKIGSGATPRGGSSVYRPSGVALIRSQNVLDHEFSRSGLAFIDDDAADALRGVTIEEGDVLLNITGDSILRSTVVPQDVLPARVSQHVAIIRTVGRLDPLVLQKFLTHPAMKDWMLGLSSGGTRKAITKGHIESFVVPLPPPEEQRAIAEVLGALDDKIESNRRLASLVDSLAAARFKAADMEPRSLAEVAVLTMGSSPPGDTYNEDREGLPFYQGVKDFGFRFPGYRIWCNAPARTAEPGDTLISVRAPVGRLNTARERCCIGRGIAGVSSVHPSTLYYALRGAHAAWEPFHGEGTVFGAINRDALSKVKVPWPRCGVDELEEALNELDAQLNEAMLENETLVALRDALLPELLSGRLRVPEAERVVEEVV